ncbi:CLIP domain-containing serine protease 14D-like isoform X2 [Maniola jurtina]|uniref:CLIP domain-containing serine protease 14D-like isoform X2 n=1 Tax=Maniola jurtina TaxID=191418 RepID=UPI001E685F81|nr:CLIP domain-containing serine protease 14D-like isoform X2 [Maniola jurtina]
MDYVTRSIILLVILSSVESLVSEKAEEQCIKLNGTCKVITDCEYVVKLISSLASSKETDNTRKQLRNMLCGFQGSTPVVCCPDVPPNSDFIVYNKSEETATNRPKTTTTPLADLVRRTTSTFRTTEAATATEIPIKTEPPTEKPDPFPDREICGESTGSDRIIGGTIAAIDEFPWMALVKYLDHDNKFQLSCSATLITDRHLLSAAHCFSGHTLTPVSIRLGEWNTQSPNECFDSVCADPPVEIEIEKVFLYPKYKKEALTFGDIAVIKLKQPVNFTDFIQPICLPTTEYIKMQDYTRDSSYWTAGWGVTEFGETSMVKRKVDVEAVPIDICRAAIPYIPESSSQFLICAGGRGGKDSCRGDSGGPLMREVRENYRSNWFLYGITSFGGKACGQAGIPGAYTRVTAYMDWIRDIVQT